MILDLVDYELKARKAVQAFWASSVVADQGKHAVTADKNMAGFMALVHDVVRANGLADADIHQNRAASALPGYFRPANSWDMVIINKGHLVAVIKADYQIASSSHSSNFDARFEKAIGNAYDLKMAYATGSFGEQSAPFVGMLMLIEDSPKSRIPIRDKSSHFAVREEFRATSFVKRYELLCEKLVMDRHYTAASLIASQPSSAKNGSYTNLSPLTSLKTFVIALAGHVTAEATQFG